MRRHIRAAAIGSLLVLPLSGMAAAAVIPSGNPGPGLASVGPVSATDGFPVWYKDKNGMRLTNCVALADPFCPARGELPDETSDISFPDNYPDEGFYALADGIMDSGNAGKARAVIAVEQAFRNAGVADGDQVTFARVRYKITNVRDGVDYKITSPVGTKTLQSSKPGLIFDTEDVGIGGVGDFSGALGGRIGPFLTWDTFPTDATLKPDAAGKDTYIGDGATEHAIKGSPFGTNFFRVEGPGINPNATVDACPTVTGPLADCIQQNLFTIQGKLATTNGVTPDRAVYTRTAAGTGQIDAFATSEADTAQSIQVSDANTVVSAREFGTTGMPGASNHYFTRVTYTGATPPAKVQVSNIGDVPVTNKLVDVVDGVTGTATFDTNSSTLTVNAVSSDTFAPPALTATDLGPLTAGKLTATLLAPPAAVTVRSAAGGSVDIPVQVTGAARAADPVVASAGPDQSVVTGAKVTLDGTASRGDIRTVAWTSTGGITLTNPNTLTPTFTAPGVGTYTLTLKVTGPDGTTSTDTVTVTVTGAVTPVANAGTPITGIARGTTVTLDGSASTGATSFAWTQVQGAGDPAVTLTNAATAKPTFTFPLFHAPASTGALTFKLTITGSGPASSSTVTVTPANDSVPISAARYTPSKNEWRVDGTSTIKGGQTVTAHVGSLTGPVVGTAVVDATGAYSVRGNKAGVVGTTTSTVFVESTLGGTFGPFTIRVG